MIRGVRGATTAADNSRPSIMDATAELLRAMVEANRIQSEDLGAVIFSATPDLNAAFAPTSARQLLGWNDVPLFSAQELAVDNSVPHCIRVLMLWNTDLPQSQVETVYLRGAASLREDALEGGRR